VTRCSPVNAAAAVSLIPLGLQMPWAHETSPNYGDDLSEIASASMKAAETISF